MPTHKVNGERCFVEKLGPVSFVTRRNREMNVVMWSKIQDVELMKQVTTCLDTEFSIVGGFYLVDVLMVDGSLTPANHGMDYVHDYVHKNRRLIDYLCIRVRDYWIHGLTKPSEEFRDYTDGIVAIHPEVTRARKITDSFSIEVRLRTGEIPWSLRKGMKSSPTSKSQ